MAAERLIQFIWKYRLFHGKPLKTTCGQELEVLDPGEANCHSGPDFFNARIRLGPLIWAGNVEVHLFASQWKLHGHHLDPAYDNVILHVVHQFDLEIKNSKGRSIPALIVDPRCLANVAWKDLRNRENWPLCQDYIDELVPEFRNIWFKRLYAERLDQKVQQIRQILKRYPDDEEQALFITLASGFGLHINSLPFEILASRIPSSLLLEIKDCLPDVEALLFGQSGLLSSPMSQGAYAASLLKRYKKLQKFLTSDPLPSHLWKFMRTRPASFPTLRLAQFASLLHAYYPLCEFFTEPKSILTLEQSFSMETSSYWNKHYIFDRPSPYSVKKMGKQSIMNLVINVILPFMEALHRKEPEKFVKPTPLTILQQMTSESNHIIKKWTIFGITPGNAFESQALIQLYNEYCKQKRCKDCVIGKMKPACCP